MPTTEITADEFRENSNILDLLYSIGFIPSKGEGRRLISQGGLYVNDERVDSIERQLTGQDLRDGSLLVRRGKKTYHRIVVK